MATNRLPGNPVDHTHTFARWPTLWTHTQHQHRYLKYIDNQTNAGSPRVPLTAYYEFAVKCNFLIFSCDGLVGRGRDHPVAICLFSSENFKGSPPSLDNAIFDHHLDSRFEREPCFFGERDEACFAS